MSRRGGSLIIGSRDLAVRWAASKSVFSWPWRVGPVMRASCSCIGSCCASGRWPRSGTVWRGTPNRGTIMACCRPRL